MSKAVFSLWHREIVRFVRDRSRLTGSLMQPIIFWLLFSGALNTSVQFGGMESYSEYFFSGTLAMITLFTAIFSTITVIEDRKEGFLQGVLVSPVPRAAIALAVNAALDVKWITEALDRVRGDVDPDVVVSVFSFFSEPRSAAVFHSRTGACAL